MWKLSYKNEMQPGLAFFSLKNCQNFSLCACQFNKKKINILAPEKKFSFHVALDSLVANLY